MQCIHVGNEDILFDPGDLETTLAGIMLVLAQDRRNRSSEWQYAIRKVWHYHWGDYKQAIYRWLLS
jgi:hypothetical protein